MKNNDGIPYIWDFGIYTPREMKTINFVIDHWSEYDHIIHANIE